MKYFAPFTQKKINMEFIPKIQGEFRGIVKSEMIQTKNGEKLKETLHIETVERFSKTIFPEVLGKPELTKQLKHNDLLCLSVDISSREYNGKYYHNINVYQIERENPQTRQWEKVGIAPMQQSAPVKNEPTPEQKETGDFAASYANDDIPF